MRTLSRISWARWWLIMALLSVGCGGGPVRDRARTAADLSRERPAPLSSALTEREREARRLDVDELAAHIDARLASSDRIPAGELLDLATALEVSDEVCGPPCERRLMSLYDGLALLHAGHFRFSTAAPGEASARDDGMLARAPELARWAIGRVLAEHDEPATVSLALQRLAARERDDEGDLTEARHYLEWAISVEPSDAAHAALGAICYRLGDLSCGDRALSELDDSPERASIERLRDAARTVAAPATELDDLLRRADALVNLQRNDEAIALFEQLVAEHPDDARPLVGRAQMVFLDLAGVTDPIGYGLRAGTHLDRAAGLSHREARYYELATLVWSRRLFSVVMGNGSTSAEDLVAQLSDIVAGFREIDAGTAAAIDLYGRMMLGWIGAENVDAPTLEEALALVARHPDNAHLRRCSLVLAVSGDVRPAGDAFVAVPGEEETLALVRVAAAMQWDDLSLMRGVELEGEAGAIALSLRARRGEATWEEVTQRFHDLAEHAHSANARRLLNGYGVGLWWAGQREGARELFAQLSEPAPTLNRLAITDASLRDDAWVEEVEALMAIDDPGIACGAARLLEASGAGTQTDTDAACARSGELPPRSGTFSTGGTFDFQFSLSARTGFDSHIEVALEPWLLVAP